MKCQGKDKNKYEINWTKIKGAYLPAGVVCNQRLSLKLNNKPKLKKLNTDITSIDIGVWSCLPPLVHRTKQPTPQEILAWQEENPNIPFPPQGVEEKGKWMYPYEGLVMGYCSGDCDYCEKKCNNIGSGNLPYCYCDCDITKTYDCGWDIIETDCTGNPRKERRLVNGTPSTDFPNGSVGLCDCISPWVCNGFGDCVCPPPNFCIAPDYPGGMVKNQETCECECPPGLIILSYDQEGVTYYYCGCPSSCEIDGQIQNEETCECSCPPGQVIKPPNPDLGYSDPYCDCPDCPKYDLSITPGNNCECECPPGSTPEYTVGGPDQPGGIFIGCSCPNAEECENKKGWWRFLESCSCVCQGSTIPLFEVDGACCPQNWIYDEATDDCIPSPIPTPTPTPNPCCPFDPPEDCPQIFIASSGRCWCPQELSGPTGPGGGNPCPNQGSYLEKLSCTCVTISCENNDDCPITCACLLGVEDNIVLGKDFIMVTCPEEEEAEGIIGVCGTNDTGTLFRYKGSCEDGVCYPNYIPCETNLDCSMCSPSYVFFEEGNRCCPPGMVWGPPYDGPFEPACWDLGAVSPGLPPIERFCCDEKCSNTPCE